MLKAVLVCKDGYRQGGYSRGLLYIKLAQDRAVRDNVVPGIPSRIVFTAGSNGKHSTKGPHFKPRWEANDVRTKDWRVSLERKESFMAAVLVNLDDGPLQRGHTRQGWVKIWTANYIAILEWPGGKHEHIHTQVRIGRTIT